MHWGYGNNVNMNEVWTIYDVCTWNYISIMVGTVNGIVWGHDGCGGNLATPRLLRIA